MKPLVAFASLAIAASAIAEPAPRTAATAAELVPAGYVLVQAMEGDLNKDQQPDTVLLIKGTDKTRWVTDPYRGELDRNRRGLLVALKQGDHYTLALENRECFSSENEDGGVYYAPELDIAIEKGSLLLSYAHGRYGYWSYRFRYEQAGFTLIGYDGSSNHGPVVQQFTSINFLTRKQLTRVNTNPDAEGGDERFKETWQTFTLARPVYLAEVKDFDELDVVGLVEKPQ